MTTSRMLRSGDVVTVFADYRKPGCTDRRETVVAEVSGNGMFFLDVDGGRHRVADAELAEAAQAPAPAFTVARPSDPRPAAPGTPGPLAPLGEKRMSWNPLFGRPECSGAETADKAWDFQRWEDEGTTWSVMHAETRTVVKDYLGSLTACRAYVGSGEAWTGLEVILAHQQGGHDGNAVRECPECQRTEASCG